MRVTTRAIRRAASALALAVTCAAAMTTGASASTTEPVPTRSGEAGVAGEAAYVLTIQHVIKVNGKWHCLDHSNSYGLRTYPCNGGNYQKWRSTHTGDVSATYYMRNVATGKCLDDSNSYGLRAYPCNGGKYQKWFHVIVGNGYQGLQNLATGRCLERSSYGTLRTTACGSSGAYQGWDWDY